MIDAAEVPTFKAALAEHSALVHWIDEHYTGISLGGETREHMAYSCLDVALEHQMAIDCLAHAGLHGSMLAMVRPLFESMVRGSWLARCATDAEIERFRTRDKIKQDFGELVEAVERKIGDDRATLMGLKANSWSAMSSFTHTGMMQMTRRYAEGTTGPNYRPDDLVKGLNVSGVLGLLAAVEMATIAGNSKLALETLERAKLFAARPKSAA